MSSAKPQFIVDLHDSDGDVFESGIWFSFGRAFVRVADSADDLDRFIDHLRSMSHEIGEACGRRAPALSAPDVLGELVEAVENLDFSGELCGCGACKRVVNAAAAARKELEAHDVT